MWLQNKLLGGPVACPVSGSCDSVLNSDYSQVFGLPLSLLGEPPLLSGLSYTSWPSSRALCTS